jgi:hypothetical protein
MLPSYRHNRPVNVMFDPNRRVESLMDMELHERLTTCLDLIRSISVVLARTLFTCRGTMEDNSDDPEFPPTSTSKCLEKVVDALEGVVRSVGGRGVSGFLPKEVQEELTEAEAKLEALKVTRLYEISTALRDHQDDLLRIARRHEAVPIGQLAGAGITPVEISEIANPLGTLAFRLSTLLHAKNLTPPKQLIDEGEGPQGAGQVSAEMETTSSSHSSNKKGGINGKAKEKHTVR